MTSPQSWVSFDCYGTLVDWRSGMLTCFTAVVGSDRALPILKRYHTHEPELQTYGEFLSYRTVMRSAFRQAGADLGLALSDEQVALLPDSVPSWPVFEEVPEMLRALHRAGHRLAILSNIDDDIIRGTLPQLGEPIDVVITSQEVGSYKPAPGHFDAMQRRAGAIENWMHVGCSYFHDVEPCTRRDVVGIMINRDGRPGPFDRAAAVLNDVGSLPQAIARLRPYTD